MGVLACSRGRCENIMCDRGSSEYGYICEECFQELISLGVETDIEKFMASDPKRDHAGATEAYFDKIFPERDY